MAGDWSFVVWIVVIAIPLGTALAARWAHARRPGDVMLGKASAEDLRDAS